MNAPRPGLDYIVCDCCGSQIELTQDAFDHFEEWPEAQGAWLGFTCDNDECQAAVTAWVLNPEPMPEAM